MADADEDSNPGSGINRTLEFGDGLDSASVDLEYPDYVHDEVHEEDTVELQRQEHLAQLEGEAAKSRDYALKMRQENARILLSRVMKSPFNRNKKSLLLKFFLRWSKMLPLYVKCDELAKQLQDRITAIASIRDSYLRDVVRVKYHLQKIQEFKLPGEEQPALLQQTGHDMYDLHVVPSISLRKLIDRAVQKDGSSAQLQETLIQAGLVNVATGKAFNAWEKGKNFNKIMKHNRGPAYKSNPIMGGESISCSVPQTHELYVRYCKQCIGVMQFVRTWNFEVEDSLRYKVEGQIMERQIGELRDTIDALNKIIGTQEQNIVDKEAIIDDLRKSQKFMDQWSYQQEMADREAALRDEKRKMRDERDMVLADKESTAIEVDLKRNEERRVWKLKDARMRHDVAVAVEEKDKETRLRLEMLGHLTASQTRVIEQDAAILKLTEETNAQKKLIVELRATAEAAEKEKKLVTGINDVVSADLAALKTQSTATIAGMQDEIAFLKEEADVNERQIANFYEECRELRNDKDAVLDELGELREYKQDLEKKERARLATIARKPKHSLKVIAMVVRCSIKIMRAVKLAQDGDFGAMGAFGRRMQLSLEDEKLCAVTVERDDAVTERDELRITKKELTMSLEKQRAITTQQRTQLSNERERVASLTDVISLNKKSIAALEKNGVEKDIRDQQRLVKISEIMKLLRRTQVLVHLQRTTILQYKKAMTRVNAVLFHTRPDTLLDEGSTLSFIARSISMDALGRSVKGADGTMRITKVSLVRMEELRSVFYKGALSLVKCIRDEKLAHPCKVFRIPSPGAEVQPTEAPSGSFLQKLKESSAEHIERFRGEVEQTTNHCNLVLRNARAVEECASKLRSTIMEKIIVIEAHAKTISELRSTVASWEDKERVRLKNLEKKERKAEQSRLERATKLEALAKSKLVSKRPIAGKKMPVAANPEVSSANPAAPSHENSTPKAIQAAPERSGGGIGRAAKREEFDMSELEDKKRPAAQPKTAAAEEEQCAQAHVAPSKKSAPSSGLLALAARADALSDDDSDVSKEPSVDPNDEIMDEMVAQIHMLMGETEDLQERLGAARRTIVTLENKCTVQDAENVQLQNQLAAATLEYEAAIGRIRVLRLAVEHNYIERRRELEELKKEHADKEASADKEKKARRRNRGTYIACSVCAIRSHEGHEGGGAHGYDDAGAQVSVEQPIVHEALADCLHGDLVLMAKPRSINKNRRKGSAPDGDVDATRGDTGGEQRGTRPHSAYAATAESGSGGAKDSKFRSIRSMPDRADPKQTVAEQVVQQQAVATLKNTPGEGKKAYKLPVGIGAPKTPMADRMDVQTSAFVQNNLLAKFKIDGAKRRPESGTRLEVTHRPLQGRPMRSLSASEMMLHLTKSVAALQHPNQAEPEAATMGDPESRGNKWRLDDGSFDLNLLESELNDV